MLQLPGWQVGIDLEDAMKQVFQIILSLFLLWTFALYAAIHIEITQGVDLARPIGVVPFKWSGAGVAPEDISNIIASDLRNSGRFIPLITSRLPQHPASATEVIPAAWMALGIDVIVVGEVQPSATDSYVISYQLVDTSSNPGAILIQNQYKVAKTWLRYAAHTASD